MNDYGLMKDILLFNELFRFEFNFENLILTNQEILILILISDIDMSTLSKLSVVLKSSKSKLSKPKLSKILYRLSKLNLIEKSYLEERVDRRIIPLKLTEFGSNYLIQVYREFNDQKKNIFLNEKEIKNFREYLTKLVESN